MARECKKCGARVPTRIIIDGKERNCQNRKYCFDCSPWGRHNTKKLEIIKTLDGICNVCGRPHVTGKSKCYTCNYNARRNKVYQKISDILGGYKCWICGYDKCKYNIHFHHVFPQDKLFQVSGKVCVHRNWKAIWQELQKCAVLCALCHGELHCDLIAPSVVEQIWRDKWKEILGSPNKLWLSTSIQPLTLSDLS